ncbi:glucose dehydrogenase [FAD, quinone]-like [Photinus pyralis]|nr:glucose dehydrogenase [FAD, quinone]-like [Photinus pyralis]
MISLLLLTLLLSSTYDHPNARTEYLVRLIQAETERSKTYPLPVDSGDYRPRTETQYELGTFDHIVIGAGSAGAIVAARLSEDHEKQVLLLEAGGHENDFTDIPGMRLISEGLHYNWNYKSVAQNNSCLIMNGFCDYRAGRGLGGSTVINGLFYSRGCKSDYDSWDSSEESNWKYDKVLPFFKRLENYKIDADSGYHGHDGPMNVDYAEPLDPKTSTFLDGNRELGQEIGDYNGANPLRAGRVQYNIIRGQRCSTGRAYLRKKYRPNLHILPHSYVTKILIDAATKRAYGVVFARHQRYLVAKSRNEIVLSAGAYRSPQLLMLSGIGPADHLINLEIPVICDLPVGKFFKDHSSYAGLNVLTNHSNGQRELRYHVEDYLKGRGELVAGPAFGATFLKSNLFTTSKCSDMEVTMYKYTEALNFFYNVTDISKAVTFFPILLHPKSFGTVSLRSSDPFQYPLINPNFWSDPGQQDVKTMLYGIRHVLKLIETKPFKEINATLMPIHLPSCSNHTYLSDEYFYCHIKYFSITYTHAIGTCKMGSDPSMGAVVDYNLRVHGVDNLMVADASVMPDTISGHTSAPTMMIGERAADIIKKKLDQL